MCGPRLPLVRAQAAAPASPGASCSLSSAHFAPLEQDGPRALPYADGDALEIKDKDGSGTGTLHPSERYIRGQSRARKGRMCPSVCDLRARPGPRQALGRPGQRDRGQGQHVLRSLLWERRPVTTTRERDRAPGEQCRAGGDLLDGVGPRPEDQGAVPGAVTLCPSAPGILSSGRPGDGVSRHAWTVCSVWRSTEAGRGGRVGPQGAPNGDPNSRALGPLSKYPEKYHPITAAAGPSPCPRTWRGRSGRRAPAHAFVGICARSTGLAPIHTSRLSGKRHIRWSRCCRKLVFTSSETTDAARPGVEGDARGPKPAAG